MYFIFLRLITLAVHSIDEFKQYKILTKVRLQILFKLLPHFILVILLKKIKPWN